MTQRILWYKNFDISPRYLAVWNRAPPLLRLKERDSRGTHTSINYRFPLILLLACYLLLASVYYLCIYKYLHSIVKILSLLFPVFCAQLFYFPRRSAMFEYWNSQVSNHRRFLFYLRVSVHRKSLDGTKYLDTFNRDNKCKSSWG